MEKTKKQTQGKKNSIGKRLRNFGINFFKKLLKLPLIVAKAAAKQGVKAVKQLYRWRKRDQIEKEIEKIDNKLSKKHELSPEDIKKLSNSKMALEKKLKDFIDKLSPKEKIALFKLLNQLKYKKQELQKLKKLSLEKKNVLIKKNKNNNNEELEKRKSRDLISAKNDDVNQKHQIDPGRLNIEELNLFIKVQTRKVELAGKVEKNSIQTSNKTSQTRRPSMGRG